MKFLTKDAPLRFPFILVLLASCATGPDIEQAAEADTNTVAEMAFRSALNLPPTGWTGPVFELSHDYPQGLPGGNPESRAPWLTRDVDFSATAPMWEDGWAGYMQDLLDYVRLGQDDALANDVGWRVEVGRDTRWYHVPWMAYSTHSGREFVHGLTNERTATEEDFVGSNHLPLATGQTEKRFETWAFGTYNVYGGYAIGQVFPPSGVPTVVPGEPAPRPRGLPFPQGTLVVKLLFTTATEADVYFLAGSPEWIANRHINDTSSVRAPAPVRLVQMDVAVSDSRSPTGWVFGTFAYNGTLPGSTIWDRLSPVGLEWGNDPETFPAVPKDDSQEVRQSVLPYINIYEHYGPEGRLVGPVDNPKASCLACHMGAFAADPVGTVSEMGKNTPCIFDFPGMGTESNQANEYFFQNIRFPDPYSDPKYRDAIPLDSSLQLLVAFKSYAEFVSGRQGMSSCSD